MNAIGRGLTLRDMWDRAYDPRALERFDLAREWRWVGRMGAARLGPALRALYPRLPEDDARRLSWVIETVIKGRPEMSPPERSLFVANVLSILSDPYIVEVSGIVRSLEEFVIDGRRAKTRRAFPSKILVELANACNLDCVMCRVGARGFDSSRVMNLALFRELVGTILHRAQTVRLNGLGESTIIPGFLGYLDAIDGLGPDLELVTNLSVPDRSVLERLLDLDFSLFISCDAVDRRTLSQIRRNLDVDQFLANMRFLSAQALHRRRDPLKTHIIMTLLESNFRQLPTMVEFAARHRVGGVIANMVKGGGGHWKTEWRDEIVGAFREADREARRLGILLMVPDQIEGSPVEEGFVAESNYRGCPTYMEEAFIRYNGDACPCNMMNPYVYGNLRRNPMDEVLRGVPSLLFDYLMESQAKHPYCVNCYYLRRRSPG